MGKPYASGSDIRHAHFYSYTNKYNLIPYYTTIENNQLIDFNNFWDSDNIHANFIWIESVDSALYISFNDDEGVVFIPTGHCREISYIDCTSMTIYNPLGTKLRFYIQTF